jgi:hypothetical protein
LVFLRYDMMFVLFRPQRVLMLAPRPFLLSLRPSFPMMIDSSVPTP